MTARFDTGYPVKQAVQHASAWWDSKCRHLVKPAANEVETGRKVAVSSGSAPGLVIPGARTAVLFSGILQGKTWAELTQGEQVRVVRIWHHHFVRVRQVAPEEHPEEYRRVAQNLDLN